MPTRDRSRVVDTAVVAVPEVQLLWVTPGSVPEVLNPVKKSTIMWANLGGSVVIENVGIHGIYIGIPLCYHNRASPKLDGYLSSSVPTLSISDAERGVYHDRRVSDAPIIIVSSTR